MVSAVVFAAEVLVFKGVDKGDMGLGTREKVVEVVGGVQVVTDESLELKGRLGEGRGLTKDKVMEIADKLFNSGS